MVEQVFADVPDIIPSILTKAGFHSLTFDKGGLLLRRQGYDDGATVIHSEGQCFLVHNQPHVIGMVPAIAQWSLVVAPAVPSALP